MADTKCPGTLILKSYDATRILRVSGRTIVSGFHSPVEKDCLDILLRGSTLLLFVVSHLRLLWWNFAGL